MGTWILKNLYFCNFPFKNFWKKKRKKILPSDEKHSHKDICGPVCGNQKRKTLIGPRWVWKVPKGGGIWEPWQVSRSSPIGQRRWGPRVEKHPALWGHCRHLVLLEALSGAQLPHLSNEPFFHLSRSRFQKARKLGTEKEVKIWSLDTAYPSSSAALLLSCESLSKTISLDSFRLVCKTSDKSILEDFYKSVTSSYALKNVDRAQRILRAWIIIIIMGGLISLFSGISDIHLLLFQRFWRIHLLHPPRFDRIKDSAMFA